MALFKRKDESAMTIEELEMKKKSRFRLFVLLVVVDLALFGYLIYEMITAFTAK